MGHYFLDKSSLLMKLVDGTSQWQKCLELKQNKQKIIYIKDVK